jgi:REP element-mobilizing transposase RayT
MNDDPLAYFVTWTVYGTFLQGDERGWRRRRKCEQLPQPRLAEWRHKRLKHPILLLNTEQQAAIERVVSEHCQHRGWQRHAVSVRTNHVHVVVASREHSGKQVRDQLKANATRALRESWSQFCGRPVWTAGGDWQCINSDDDLEAVVVYVVEAQDRMEYKFG